MSSSKEQYTEATVCFPVSGGMVLLAEKQKKIGAGFLNGFGGKAELGDEDIVRTNQRETEEEVGITVTDVEKRAEVIFHNPSKDETLQRIRVHFFVATQWLGKIQETDEMRNPEWYPIELLDYERFLAADRLFIPYVLAGKKVKGEVFYNDDWSVRSYVIDEVISFP